MEPMEEFDRILAEKGVKIENHVSFDWETVEYFLREEVNTFASLLTMPSPPPPLSPASEGFSRLQGDIMAAILASSSSGPSWHARGYNPLSHCS